MLLCIRDGSHDENCKYGGTEISKMNLSEQLQLLHCYNLYLSIHPLHQYFEISLHTVHVHVSRWCFKSNQIYNSFFFSVHSPVLRGDFHCVIWNDTCMLIIPFCCWSPLSPQRNTYQILNISEIKSVTVESEARIHTRWKDAWLICVTGAH